MTYAQLVFALYDEAQITSIQQMHIQYRVAVRAYVQVIVDSYRARLYSADDSTAGLERNCGINGLSWKDNR